MALSFMLAKEYTKDMKIPRKVYSGYNPPVGWLLSEKFDGYRARWEPGNNQFVSRSNKVYSGTPDWFKNAIPDVHLDGELFAGRENFQDMGVVRKKEPEDEEWLPIKYFVYDLPEETGTFKERIIKLKEIVKKAHKNWEKIREDYPEPFCDIECPIVFTEQIEIKSMKHLEEIYKDILNKGGEGVMIKDPKSLYEDKRSDYMLKYKPCFDAEAVIVDYKEGNGKYEGLLGAFICKPLVSYGNYSVIDDNENHIFTLSGMDDEIRENYLETHPEGTVITYEYSGKTDTGKPRFARYLRVRDDIEIKENVNSCDKRDRIIEIFSKLAQYETNNGQGFKAAAYHKSIIGIKKFVDDSEITIENLKTIKGLGEKLIGKIQEIMEKDTCSAYEKIKNIKDLRTVFMGIHGVGPKNAKKLVDAGFKSIEDLRECENIEEYLNEVQIKSLPHYEDLQLRIPREEIQTHEKYLKLIIKIYDIPPGSIKFCITGSYRRGKVDSGDIDVLLTCKDKKKYKQFIEALKESKYLVEHLAEGPKKYNGICKYGKNPCRRIDIMYTKPEEYPFAVLYFTGSKEFNVKMRADLLERGLSLNEYSLKDSNTKKPVNHTFVEEKDIFDYLDMEYVHPCDR
jgi:DNA polymerase/3'-5' exonuclease PolX